MFISFEGKRIPDCSIYRLSFLMDNPGDFATARTDE
jgi:hypothetical protein